MVCREGGGKCAGRQLRHHFGRFPYAQPHITPYAPCDTRCLAPIIFCRMLTGARNPMAIRLIN